MNVTIVCKNLNKMKKLTEEKLNINFTTFVKVLKKYGLYTDKLASDDIFNDKLKTSPSHSQEDSGGAYDGSLIEHIMLITSYAKKINDILPDGCRVDQNKLLKVCFLHQIGKVKQFIENTNDFDIKRGKFYKFSDGLPSLKTGELSLFIAIDYGIEILQDEFEAILSLDKEDEQNKYFSSVLSKILKISNELAEIERKNNFLNYKNKC
jgi:hypothetical protein